MSDSYNHKRQRFQKRFQEEEELEKDIKKEEENYMKYHVDDVELSASDLVLNNLKGIIKDKDKDTGVIRK